MSLKMSNFKRAVLSALFSITFNKEDSNVTEPIRVWKSVYKLVIIVYVVLK